ncbi:23S rRNA (adenosine(1067)-2'-O)-methyltransferase [bacterium HR40]|nr:23S rRNA (adenosine(1067)-2'-O)-methyltransferase [bacterium HR40]
MTDTRSASGPTAAAFIARYRAARADPTLVVLEGFHALKHALRFGADILEAVAVAPQEVLALARDLAPDLLPVLPALLRPVEARLFAELAPDPPATGVLALARRPPPRWPDLAAAELPAVLLDRPAHAGNLGAVIRVAAAAGAPAVLVTGDWDPWHPRVVRTAAGLHFALPVLRLSAPLDPAVPVVAFDPAGEPFDPGSLPRASILAFGSERRGLSVELRERATLRLRLPMRPGVSSLNLATAVAAVLYLARAACPAQQVKASSP